MSRHLLVVATESVDPSGVASTVDRYAGSEASIHVVVPASSLARLDWLTNAEDGARREAADHAVRIANGVRAPAEPHVGDVDPLQAIVDALRTFPADELVLITTTVHEAGWLETDLAARSHEQFGLPITHLVAPHR